MRENPAKRTLASGGDVGEKMRSGQHGGGVKQAEEITAMDGIDVLWIGRIDLSTGSIGINIPAYRCLNSACTPGHDWFAR
jgi:hypothetical protein